MASRTPARNTRGVQPATKRIAKGASRLTRYSKGEYIKVAPLHSLKPINPHLTYFGGPLLTNVQVFNIFWGKKWSAGSGASVAAKLDAFFRAILVSPLIDQLSEYTCLGSQSGTAR